MRKNLSPRLLALLVVSLPVAGTLGGCAAEGGEETSDSESAVGDGKAPTAASPPIVTSGDGCAHQYANWFDGTASVGHVCESRKVTAKYFSDELFEFPSGELAKKVPTSSVWHESSPASRAALLGVVMDRAERGDKEAESLLKLFFGDFKRFVTEGFAQKKGQAYEAAKNVILNSMREKMKLGELNDRYRDLTLADLPLGSLFDVFGGAPPGIDLRKVAEELFGSAANTWPDAKLLEEIRKLGVPVEGGSIVGKTLDSLSAQARALLDPNVWLRKGYDLVLNTVSDFIASRIRVNELVDVIVGSVIHTTIKEAGAYVLGTLKAGTTAFSSAFFAALYANVFFAVAVHFVIEPVLGGIVDLISFLLAGDLEERQCTSDEVSSVKEWFVGKPRSSNGKSEQKKLQDLMTVARYSCMNGTKPAVANKIETANVQVDRLACVVKENARQTVYGSEFDVRCESCYRTRPETCRTVTQLLPSQDMREVKKVAPGAFAAYRKMLTEKYLAQSTSENEAITSVVPVQTAYQGRAIYDKIQVTSCAKLDPATTCADLVMQKHDAYVAKCQKNPLDPSCSGCGRLPLETKQLAQWEVWTRPPRVMSERAYALNDAHGGDLRPVVVPACGGTSKVQYNPVTERSYCCPVDLGESRVLTPAERDKACSATTNSVICEKSGVCTWRGGRCVARSGKGGTTDTAGVSDRAPASSH